MRRRAGTILAGLAIVLAAASASLAQGMVLFIEIGRANPQPVRPSGPINDLRGLTSALRACWNPPPLDSANGPVDVTFTVSFKRSGELLGKPSVVTFTRAVTDEQRTRYYTAVAEAIDLCSHMPFTDSMGGAVAGRAFRVNFVDKRGSKRI